MPSAFRSGESGAPSAESAGGPRRTNTPLRMQMHTAECGAACLGSVLAYFGLWVPLTELRGRCEVSRDGSTAAGIMRAARHYGLECTGRSVDVRLLRKMPLPLVLFWEFNHFLILEGFDRESYFLNDPATGRRKVTAEEFSRSYTGVALRFRPGPDFRQGGDRPSILRHVPAWFRGAWGGVAFALACGLLLALLSLAMPFVLGVFVDHALGESRPWGGLLAGILAAAAALAYGTTVLKERCLQRLAVRLSITTGNRAVSKLLRLPVEYFSHRLAGEVSSRILAIDRIAAGFPHHVLGLMIDVAMSSIFLAAMLALDLRLALIVLALGILNAAIALGAARLRTDANHAWRREQGLLTGVGTLMLHNANSLRMAAADDSFFARWSAHQARELTARQRFAELSHVIASMPGLFLILASAAVLAFGATDVMEGRMTVGALASFYFLAFLFLAPVSRFAELADQHQELEADIQRLEDITQFPEDPGFQRDRKQQRGIATLHGRLRLAGHVELQDITFGYNRARPPLIKDFNLVIEPGQRIAIVGASGSGKSTLSRLVSGLYEPWSGAILFDGRPPHEIPREVLSRSLSVADQRSALFSGTVRDNITLWNPAVPDDLVVAAARDLSLPHS